MQHRSTGFALDWRRECCAPRRSGGARSIVLAVLVAALVAACDAYDRDLGPAPYLCGNTAPRCPMDYACMTDGITGHEVCVRDDSELSTELECADDSELEPNNVLDEASPSSIDSTKTFSASALAICPAGDRDLFEIAVSTEGTNVEMTVEYDAAGASLQAALLNAGGVPIATAEPVTNAPRTLHATASLPIGTYYASITAPVTETISVNNYQLSITATPP
jgi:hypothetical protein